MNAYQVLSSDNNGLHSHGYFRTWAEASAKLDTMIPKSHVETSWLEAVVVSEAEPPAICTAQQGHYWENCASPCLRLYQACKWCGAERNA